MGLAAVGGTITVSEPAPPPASNGLLAKRNLEGWDQRLVDLPMEDREISQWAPNWRGSGYHHVSRTIRAFPIRHHPAKLLTLSAKVLEHLDGAAIVRFRIDQPLDRSDQNFAESVQFNLRLLRETIGEASLFDADLSDVEYAAIQRVDWELLPPGAIDLVLKRLATKRSVSLTRLQVAEERLRALDRLQPTGYIVGRGSFTSYFGAKFGNRIVVLESLDYGNALYLFHEDWEQLSQLSRTELIKRRDPAVQRIPHKAGWQSAIRQCLRDQR